jgi:hypothetical protein
MMTLSANGGSVFEMQLLGMRGRHERVACQVKRLLILLLFTVVPIQTFAQPRSVPERRVAFVVGIGAYKNAPRLANPVNDARAMSSSPEFPGRRGV